LLPSDTVLDIACGAGYGTDLLSRHCRMAIGLDKSRAAIDYAQRTFGGTYLVADFFDRVRGMDVFDGVVSFETIEHIDARMEKILKTLVSRASKTVVGSVPYLEPPGNPYHKHFMLSEGDLLPLRHYGELNLYYQEREPGCRILPELIDQPQNLIFVLRRGGSPPRAGKMNMRPL
jgi:SAM-dependent methyltransferase